MAIDFTTLIAKLESLKNDILAESYRIQGTQKDVNDALNAIAPFLNGSQNGPQALSQMQTVESELNKALELAQDAAEMCDKDIKVVQSH